MWEALFWWVLVLAGAIVHTWLVYRHAYLRGRADATRFFADAMRQATLERLKAAAVRRQVLTVKRSQVQAQPSQGRPLH